jgi:hypothetical protein
MPYNRVVAFGDSFTRGDELTDCQDQIPGEINQAISFSNNTWPALVAKQLSAEYDCIAVGGKGNHWISWQVSRILHKLTDTLLIINWSWFERFDYVDIETNQWIVTHPRHDDKLNHYFYKNLDNELWNIHRNLQQIHSTICLLQQNKIDFIMTCQDVVNRSGLVHNDWQDSVNALQDQISQNIVNFYGYTFLEWSKHKSFELGPGGHPLEQAHSEAASYILDKCNKYLYNKRIE